MKKSYNKQHQQQRGRRALSPSCDDDDVDDGAFIMGQQTADLDDISGAGTDNSCCASSSTSSKKRKCTTAQKKAQKAPVTIGIETDPEKYPHLAKYFAQRLRFWSKFDSGIVMDEESWYSVTPEAIASHIARRTKATFPSAKIVLDAFTGPGGNAIQFAHYFDRVIAVDIDPVKLSCSQHNAKIYGVQDKIEWIQGDFMKLLPTLKADIVFLSPPWGGPEYSHYALFDIKNMLWYDGCDIFRKAAQYISPHIVYFLPRNILAEQLTLLAGPGHVL